MNQMAFQEKGMQPTYLWVWLLLLLPLKNAGYYPFTSP